MTTVAVIGLGIMGGPMARSLLRAGFDVIGFNRSRAKVDRLVADGGRGAADVHEAVRAADVVLTVLPDSPDVESVVLGHAREPMRPAHRPSREKRYLIES